MEKIKDIPPGYEYIIVDRCGDHEHIEIMRHTNKLQISSDIRVVTGAEMDVSDFAKRLGELLKKEMNRHVKEEGPNNTGNKTE